MDGLFFLLLRLLIILSSHSTRNNAQEIISNFTAIYSFGDSYTDTGNNAFLLASTMSSITTMNPPYGETFFGFPNGRATNGRLIIDFIAEELGLPLLPPYLAHNGSIARGVNFAVAGGTALNVTYFEENNLTKLVLPNSSLNFQLEWFDSIKPSLCRSTEECKRVFERALFMVGEIGVNDYSLILQAGKTVDEIAAHVPLVIHSISAGIERLIENGASTLAVSGVPASGCLPYILANFQSQKVKKSDYDPVTGCRKDYNNLLIHHNSMLKEALQKLREKYPHAKIIYASFYKPVMDFVTDPRRFGFIGGTIRACCGRGEPYNMNMSEFCGTPGVVACADPSTYLSWDGVHLTEAAYYYVAKWWLHGPYAHPPIITS